MSKDEPRDATEAQVSLLDRIDFAAFTGAARTHFSSLVASYATDLAKRARARSQLEFGTEVTQQNVQDALVLPKHNKANRWFWILDSAGNVCSLLTGLAFSYHVAQPQRTWLSLVATLLSFGVAVSAGIGKHFFRTE